MTLVKSTHSVYLEEAHTSETGSWGSDKRDLNVKDGKTELRSKVERAAVKGAADWAPLVTGRSTNAASTTDEAKLKQMGHHDMLQKPDDKSFI